MKIVFTANTGNIAVLDIHVADAEGERRIGVNATWIRPATDEEVAECDAWFKEAIGGVDEFHSVRDSSTEQSKRRVGAFLATGMDLRGGNG